MRKQWMVVALVAIAGCASDSDTASSGSAVVGSPERPVEASGDLMAQIEQTAADLRALQEGVADESGTASEVMPSGRPLPASAGRDADEVVEVTAAAPEINEQMNIREASSTSTIGASPTIAETARALAAALRRGDVDPVRAYAALAALDMVAPGVMVNPSAIEGLTPADARVLEAWADLMRGASDGLDSSPGDARALARAVRDAAEAAESLEPLEITTASLCSRVEGFGNYTPMSATWLAGRAQRTIVYAEVDHFATRLRRSPAGEEQHEVRLTQELQLYHDADGLLAWRMPAQDVVDISRNRRRDFFVVQMIDLPATLSVGRYQLKVTLRDEATRETCETVLPVLVVADEALVGPTPVR